MSIIITRERMYSFILGMAGMLTLFLLTGAVSDNPVGKYQMETLVRSNITQIYVMDTTTGKVKWVEKMDTPFEATDGK